MSSRHVDEVFAEDAILRRKIKDICKKHMQVDEAIDQEVRDRIKNLEEGTQAWDVEYAKVLEQIKAKHGVKSDVIRALSRRAPAAFASAGADHFAPCRSSRRRTNSPRSCAP